jgi:hypothetical protein
MPTKDRIDAQNLYANILEEIKWRIAAIDHCTVGHSGLLPHFIKEFCYLQIRMICELIALGCLVAHGDIEETSTKKLNKAWAADEIMNALERLHPNFYPKPIVSNKISDGINIEFKINPLLKPDLLKIYYGCGEILHRGSVRKLLEDQFPEEVDLSEITALAQKIVDLLSHHTLFMKNGEQMFIAMLRNIDDNMKVQVAIAGW